MIWEDNIAKLISFIKDDLLFSQLDVLTNDSSLIAFGLDSLKMMRLAAFIEETFLIRLKDVDITPENFSTLSQLINLIHHYCHEKCEN